MAELFDECSSTKVELDETTVLEIVEVQKVLVVRRGFDEQKNAVVGTVRVANSSYEKIVQVRYTFDEWNTPCRDLNLIWEGSVGENKTTDRFGLIIPLPSLQWRGCVEFAIKCEVNGQIYWDNNHKKNYKETITRRDVANPVCASQRLYIDIPH